MKIIMRLYYVKDALGELEVAIHLLVINNIHPWDDPVNYGVGRAIQTNVFVYTRFHSRNIYSKQ